MAGEAVSELPVARLDLLAERFEEPLIALRDLSVTPGNIFEGLASELMRRRDVST